MTGLNEVCYSCNWLLAITWPFTRLSRVLQLPQTQVNTCQVQQLQVNWLQSAGEALVVQGGRFNNTGITLKIKRYLSNIPDLTR